MEITRLTARAASPLLPSTNKRFRSLDSGDASSVGNTQVSKEPPLKHSLHSGMAARHATSATGNASNAGSAPWRAKSIDTIWRDPCDLVDKENDAKGQGCSFFDRGAQAVAIDTSHSNETEAEAETLITRNQDQDHHTLYSPTWKARDTVHTHTWNNADYTVAGCAPPLGLPMPPMMRFTSSAAFSDISMPIHGLTASRSFGPNGLFFGPPVVPPNKPMRGPSQVFGTPMPPPGPFSRTFSRTFSVGDRRESIGNANGNFPSVANDASRSGTIAKQSHGDNKRKSAGDIDMAASALLDLTPSMDHQNQRRYPVPHGKRLMLHYRSVPTVDPFEHGRALQHYEADSTTAQVQAVHARLAAQAQRLLQNVPITLSACKCKNTRCLKLYCTCFQAGAFCDPIICKCMGCHNVEEQSAPQGPRSRAIYEVLSRRVDAFEPRLRKKTGNGCSCKKSRCLQKYCDCFANGSTCSSACGCVGCSNTSVSIV